MLFKSIFTNFCHHIELVAESNFKSLIRLHDSPFSLGRFCLTYFKTMLLGAYKFRTHILVN